VGVGVTVAVWVGVSVAVGDGVGVAVRVEVPFGVTIGLGIAVAARVGVGDGVSMPQPEAKVAVRATAIPTINDRWLVISFVRMGRGLLAKLVLPRLQALAKGLVAIVSTVEVFVGRFGDAGDEWGANPPL
jgi:hypothetical protein